MENVNNNEIMEVSSDFSPENAISSGQTLIKIIPSANSLNSLITPIIIPAPTILKAQSINPTSAIIVNSQGKIVNSSLTSAISGATSILKPQVKVTNTQSTPMLISTNTNILKNQIKAASIQMPIIIPASTGILKTSIQGTNSQFLASVNSTNTTLIPRNPQSILIPVKSSILKSKAETTDSQAISTNATNAVIVKSESVDSAPPPIENSINCDTDKSESRSLNEAANARSKSSGISLNKTQAKKMENERFEKMDKLLLKQLKLNNALRKKLNVMNHKLQQLMKEQVNDYKEFLKDVFTDDQLRALELKHINPKSITAWSHKTMMKAIKLKQECGSRGYDELLNQNMPLPSLRTISRWCTARNMPIP